MIYALHGMLGAPSDWDFLGTSVHKVSLEPSLGLKEWAARFNASVSKEKKGGNILIGYSLGGRLALHALLQNPTLWGGAILISTHPGLQTVEERKRRLQGDLLWAKRFKTEPWEQVVQAWNSQEPLRHSAPLPRSEQDYDRQILAQTLSQWSLGLQEDLRAPLQNLRIPLLWMAGEKDEKYCELLPPTDQWICPGAGHRVPWDQPQLFVNTLNTFIEAHYAQT